MQTIAHPAGTVQACALSARSVRIELNIGKKKRPAPEGSGCPVGVCPDKNKKL
jgi:hypothetical protein